MVASTSRSANSRAMWASKMSSRPPASLMLPLGFAVSFSRDSVFISAISFAVFLDLACSHLFETLFLFAEKLLPAHRLPRRAPLCCRSSREAESKHRQHGAHRYRGPSSCHQPQTCRRDPFLRCRIDARTCQAHPERTFPTPLR